MLRGGTHKKQQKASGLKFRFDRAFALIEHPLKNQEPLRLLGHILSLKGIPFVKGGHKMKRSDKDKQQTPLPTRGQTIAVIGSATYAAKTRDVLHNAGVGAEVIKLSSTQSHAGCVYGVVFSSAQKPSAAKALDHAGIAVREYMERGV